MTFDILLLILIAGIRDILIYGYEISLTNEMAPSLNYIISEG